MKFFYKMIIYSGLLLSVDICIGMTAQEIANLRMEEQLLMSYNASHVSELLNQLAVTMRLNNQAALLKSQLKACEYGEDCFDKSAIKATLLAGHDGAHAGLKAFQEVMQKLPSDMTIFLRDKFQNLRSILLSSDNVETVNQMVENIKIYDQLTQQLIVNLNTDLQ